MPYWLHKKDTPTWDGSEHATRADALLALTAQGLKGWIITFIATDEEKNLWYAREYTRLQSGEYIMPPWFGEYWYSSRYATSHYAHLSTAVPSMVAYTPDDEFGVEDRQLRVRPGKYLKTFAPTLEQKAIDGYVADVKALTGGRYHIARDPETIVKIFMNGPSSCMDRSHFPHAPRHPCACYGDSDLGVAYIGDPLTRIVARAVVWPDRQTYSVVYGDEQLSRLLRADGYTSAGPHGAMIRIVEDELGRELCPYIDDVKSANRTADLRSSQLILRADNRGDYAVQRTSGYLDDEERSVCERCNEEHDADSALCDSCMEDSCTCDFCSHAFWPDDMDGITWRLENTESYSCGCTSVGTCEVCEVSYWVSRGLTDCRCSEHESTEYCDHCDSYYEPADSEQHADCDHQADLPLTADPTEGQTV